MNYTQLITRLLQKLDLTEADVANINLLLPEAVAIVLTSSFQKYTVRFVDLKEPDDTNQDPEPRPKRVKTVKRAS